MTWLPFSRRLRHSGDCRPHIWRKACPKVQLSCCVRIATTYCSSTSEPQQPISGAGLRFVDVFIVTSPYPYAMLMKCTFFLTRCVRGV